jgi:hypothetical protein
VETGFLGRHSGAPRSGEPGIHEHRPATVARQRELVAKKKAAGQDIKVSQSLLDTFEVTLAMLEYHLALIRKEART